MPFRCTNKAVIYKSLAGSGEGGSTGHNRGSALGKCFSFVSKIHAALSKINMFVASRKKESKYLYLQEAHSTKCCFVYLLISSDFWVSQICLLCILWTTDDVSMVTNRCYVYLLDSRE